MGFFLQLVTCSLGLPKSIQQNPSTPTINHRNKWESASIMTKYYVIHVTMIPYPNYGCIITLVTSRKQIYLISISNFSQCSCLNFIKMNARSLWKNRKWIYCKHKFNIFGHICKVDYTVETFIHAPNFSFNKVMCTLELANVVEVEKWCIDKDWT
jgi:hypothetical protein